MDSRSPPDIHTFKFYSLGLRIYYSGRELACMCEALGLSPSTGGKNSFSKYIVSVSDES